MADSLVQNYVNGLLVQSQSTEFTKLVDPVTGEMAGRSPKSTPRRRSTGLFGARRPLSRSGAGRPPPSGSRRTTSAGSAP